LDVYYGLHVTDDYQPAEASSAADHTNPISQFGNVRIQDGRHELVAPDGIRSATAARRARSRSWPDERNRRRVHDDPKTVETPDRIAWLRDTLDALHGYDRAEQPAAQHVAEFYVVGKPRQSDVMHT
jgi:hypothetical protein